MLRRNAALTLGVLGILTATASAVPVGAPPVPAGYDPGVLVNADFQAASWDQGWAVGLDAPAGAQQVLCGGDSCAQLWAASTEDVHIITHGEASLTQSVYVPLSASEMTFVYCTPNTDAASGNYGVRIDGAWTWLAYSPDWATASVPVPAGVKGTTATVEFSVQSLGDPFAVESNLYLDYVSLVPEPSCVVLVALVAAGLGRRRRRR